LDEDIIDRLRQFDMQDILRYFEEHVIFPTEAPNPTGIYKYCKQYAEEARISVRNARKDANRAIDRDEELSEDVQNVEKKKVQKLTDEYVDKIDDLLKAKTAEVMEI
jgi:hypothetical protein